MMSMDALGRLLMVLGGLLFVVGVVTVVGGRLGLGSLPGDIGFRRGNTSFYFPVVSSIVVSVVLTIALNLFLRYFR